MESEKALTDYIFSGIVKDLDAWQNCDDIYGFWLHLGLFEDDSKKPCIVSIVCLRTSVTDSQNAANYGGKWAPPLGEEYAVGLCEDPWVSEYDSFPNDEQGNALRNAFFQQRRLEGDQSGEELLWFLDVCGAVIQRIHKEGHLTRLYGKTFPIGMWISNDVGHDMTLPVTRDNNPDRISQGMEEWLMQRTYAQIAAEEVLRAEVRSWPVERQANFWWQVLRGQKLWYGKLGTSAEWEQVRELGVYEMDWESSTIALIADLIVTEVEANLSIEFPTSPKGRAMEYLLMELAALGNSPELRECVAEETITRLHTLLKRLYEESKQREKIGHARQTVARSLEVLRPERFPASHSNSQQFEPERFGLE